jgi:hypothetical protein
MLAAVLTLLALAGGTAVTFFVMDAPRRRAIELRRQLDGEKFAAERERRDNADQSRELNARDRTLAAAEAALARRTAEFERRAVTYDDLRAENQLVKADLRNMALLVAHREQLANAVGRERATLTDQRGRLGQAHLDEVLAAARRSLTVSNYPATRRRVEEAIATLAATGVPVPEEERRRIEAELQRLFDLAMRAAAEREAQALVRERIKEEQRREREARAAAEQAAQAEAERKALERSLADALRRVADEQAQADQAQAQAQAAEIEGLRAKLKEAEDRANAQSVRAIALAQITRSGFVYVISNIGSFGPNVFKIGLTRREVWMDRIDELSSASVPFPFDVHVVITSDDAPALERALHKHFHRRRVNRTNPRKEFFRVTIEEIVQAARELHGGAIEYRADAEALEFVQSQSMTDEEVEQVKSVFDEAEKTAALVADEG